MADEQLPPESEQDTATNDGDVQNGDVQNGDAPITGDTSDNEPEGNDVHPLGPGFDAEPEEDRAVTYGEVMRGYTRTDAMPLRGEGTDGSPWDEVICVRAAERAVNFLTERGPCVVLVVSASRDKLVDFWNALAARLHPLHAKHPHMKLQFGRGIVDFNVLDLQPEGYRAPFGLYTAYVGEDQPDPDVITWLREDDGTVPTTLFVLLDEPSEDTAEDVGSLIASPQHQKVLRAFEYNPGG